MYIIKHFIALLNTLNILVFKIVSISIISGETKLAPGFPSPPNQDIQGYHSYIDDTLPAESPILYGLHPNAEIGT